MEQRAPQLYGPRQGRDESSGDSTQEAVQEEVRKQLQGMMGQLQRSQQEAEDLRRELQALRAQTATAADLHEVHAFATPPRVPQHLRRNSPLPLQDREVPEQPRGEPQVYGSYLHNAAASVPSASSQVMAMPGLRQSMEHGQTGLQAPTTTSHGQTGLQAPTTTSHGQTGLQAPTTTSHGQTGLQAPTTTSHGQTGLQAPTTTSHGQTGLQAPTTTSHGQTGLQVPTTTSHGQTALRMSSASLQDVARTTLQQFSRGVGEQAALAEDFGREGPGQEDTVQMGRQRSRSPSGHLGGSATASDPMAKLLEGLEKVISGKSRVEDFGKGPTELPKLPEVSEAASVDYGDWAHQLENIMGDLSGGSAEWWGHVKDASQQFFEQYQSADQFTRLTLKPAVSPELRDQKWVRLDKRATTMLLQAVPEDVRKELVAVRARSALEVMCRLMVLYRPGSAIEKSQLLRKIEAPEPVQSPQEAVEGLRLWLKTYNRAGDLSLVVPDPSILLPDPREDLLFRTPFLGL